MIFIKFHGKSELYQETGTEVKFNKTESYWEKDYTHNKNII